MMPIRKIAWVVVMLLGLVMTPLRPNKTVASPILSASPSQLYFSPGPKITVTFSGAPGNQNDWIGLFKVGAGERAYINYEYLKGAKSGTLTFSLPEEVGSFEFRMWESEWTRIVGVSNPVKIVYPTVKLDASPLLINVGPGKKIKASYSNAPGFGNDWVGLFEVGAGARSWLNYIYTKGLKAGSMEFDAPEKPGNYELRFWTKESVSHLTSSQAIQIVWGKAEISYTLSVPDGSGKRKITVTYSGAPGYQNDWIGLFKVGAGDRTYLTYQYLKGKTSGTLLFDCPGEKGMYEFRMWANEGAKHLVTSSGFDCSGGSQPGKSSFVLKAYPGDKKVFLEWTSVQNQANLIGYNLYRKSSTESFKTPITDFPIKGLSYLDPNVDNGGTVCYYAKLVYKGNKEEGQSNEVCVVPGIPKVEVSIPNGATTSSGNYTFTGKVAPGSALTVNGKSYPVNPEGTFSVTIPLQPGVNTIKIVVTGKAGDVISITKTVTYNKPPASGKVVIVLRINQKTALVNNVAKTLDVAPFINRGRTFIPFRFIGESLGAEISFTTDAGSRVNTVSYSLGSVSIKLTIGSKNATVNGRLVMVDVPPQIIEGRTVVPLRFVTENLGCLVDWDGEEQKITIQYPK